MHESSYFQSNPRSLNLKVVSFLRVSTQEQGNDKKAGLSRQQVVISGIIERYKLNLVKTITIIDVSGTAVRHTPEVKEMLSLMDANQISGVVVADIDRLIRLDDFRDFSLLQHFKNFSRSLMTFSLTSLPFRIPTKANKQLLYKT